jgi:hypothetical protein
MPARAQQSSIDPAAISALDRMAAYIRTLKTFQVEAATTTDEAREDGQLVQYASTVTYIVRMPNKLLAEVSSSRKERQFVYDGESFTMLARRAGYYATVPAPASLLALDDMLDDKYGIELPLVDLFRWGGPRWNTKDITGAANIGPDAVDGVTCEQFAFRQDGADWQVWIQRGDFPLPRRLVITTTDDEARPRYAASFTWNLAPSVNDAAFIFTPPTDASRIVLATAGK